MLRIPHDRSVRHSWAILLIVAVIGCAFASIAIGQSVDLQVESNNDDAEEDDGGGVSRNNDKLELGQQKWVGFRFAGVTIPQGSTIVSAYVEMRATDSNSESTDLTIFGQDADDATSFGSGSNDLSSRPRTSASIAWNNVESWKKNQWHDTPDISAVVQQIVDRSGWADGNDLVILIRSDDLDGKRLAFSHDDNGNKAAKLHLVYAAGPSLVSQWTFDDGAGSVAADSQSAGNDANILGSYTWQTRCDGDGYLDLSSSSTYVSASSDSSLNFAGDATLCGWFRLNEAFDETSATSQVVMEKFASNSENLHVVLVGQDYTSGSPGDGSLVFKINGASGAYRYAWTSQTSWQANRWYHFAATIDSNTPANNRVYIDGVLDTASTSGTTAYNDMSYAASMNVGGRTTENTPGDRYLNGSVNDFRVYDYQLSATEISELVGLVAYWKFDETSGSIAADSSANGFDLTISGGATWGTGLFDNGISFDGSNGQAVNADIGTVLNGVDAVTVALWVKSSATNVGKGIFHTKSSPSGEDKNLALRYDMEGWAGGGTSLVKGALDTSAGDTAVESSSNTQTTAWQHLVLVWYSDSAPDLYVDGQLNTPSFYGDILSGVLQGVDGVTFGVGVKDAHWDGLIDDVRIYNRALCPEDIDDLADGAPSAGLRIIRWVEAR